MKPSTILISCIYFLQFAIIPTQLRAEQASLSQENQNNSTNILFDLFHTISFMDTALDRTHKRLSEFETMHHLPKTKDQLLKNVQNASQPVCLVVVNDTGVRAVAIHYVELYGVKFFYSNIKGIKEDYQLTKDVIVKRNFHDKDRLLRYVSVNNMIEEAMSTYKDYCVLFLSNFPRLDKQWTCPYFKSFLSNLARLNKGVIGHARTILYFRPDFISDVMKRDTTFFTNPKYSPFVANMYFDAEKPANSDLEKENDFLLYCWNNNISISPAIQAFLSGAELIK